VQATPPSLVADGESSSCSSGGRDRRGGTTTAPTPARSTPFLVATVQTLPILIAFILLRFLLPLRLLLHTALRLLTTPASKGRPTSRDNHIFVLVVNVLFPKLVAATLTTTPTAAAAATAAAARTLPTVAVRVRGVVLRPPFVSSLPAIYGAARGKGDSGGSGRCSDGSTRGGGKGAALVFLFLSLFIGRRQHVAGEVPSGQSAMREIVVVVVVMVVLVVGRGQRR